MLQHVSHPAAHSSDPESGASFIYFYEEKQVGLVYKNVKFYFMVYGKLAVSGFNAQDDDFL